MRREDEERLAQHYSPEAAQAPGRLPAALGIPLPKTVGLVREVFGDLDEVKRGVGWWAPHPGTSRRILISDYLVNCLAALETNLVEARVHLMEARDFAEREKRKFLGALHVNAPGQHSFAVPGAKCPADEVASISMPMHLVGCVRALASTMDCWAAVVTAILALPIPIVKTGYKEARKKLEELTASGNGLALQVNAARELLEWIRQVGPDGWDGWVLGYRNMLVHRGRRLMLVKLMGTGAEIHSPHGGTIVPLEPIPVCPNDPGRSDVEVFRDASASHFLLAESAWDTLEGATRSVKELVEHSAEVLTAVWTARRSSPSILVQPKSQWPNTLGQPVLFTGYAPGTVPFDPTELRVHPVFAKRLVVAALDDEHRREWDHFD